MFPRGFNLFQKDAPRPLSHAEYFEQPLELASGLANADVVLSGDGCTPRTDKGEVVLVRHPNALSPGTFGKLHGKLHKAKSKSSLNSMRWHDPHEQARVVAQTNRIARYFHLPMPVKLSKADRARLKREREDAELAANRAAATEAWNRLHRS